MTLWVEVLVRRDDPRRDAALDCVLDALRGLDLDASVSSVEVTDDADARALGFPGSPTVRVNGRDVAPVPPRAVSMGDRDYHDPEPAPHPPRWMVELALLEASLRGGVARVVYLEQGPARWSPLAAAMTRDFCEAAAVAATADVPERVVALGREIGLPVEAVRPSPLDAPISLGGRDVVVLLDNTGDPLPPFSSAAAAVLRWSIDGDVESVEGARRGLDTLRRRVRGFHVQPGPVAGVAEGQRQGSRPSWASASRDYAQAQMGLVALSLNPQGSSAAGARHGVSLRAEALRCAELAETIGQPLPMEILARQFGLSAEAQELVWLVWALTLDPELWLLGGGPLFSPAERVITGLVLASLLGRPPLSLSPLLEPEAPLRRFGLLAAVEAAEEVGGHPLTVTLSVPGHIAAFLEGRRALSAELAPYAQWISPLPAAMDTIHPIYIDRVLPILDAFYASPTPAAGHGPAGLALPLGLAVALRASAGSGRVFAMKNVAASLGRRVVLLDGRLLEGLPGRRRRLVLERAFEEAATFQELLVIRSAEGVAADRVTAAMLLRAIARHRAVVVLCVALDAKLDARTNQAIWLDELVEPDAVKPPPSVWMRNLPEASAALAPDAVAALSRKVALRPVQVRNAVHLGAMLSQRAEPTHALEIYADAARAQSHRGHSSLLNRDPSRSRLEDLVLPPETIAQVHAIIAAVANRDRVLREWGLRARLKKGLALTCLFDGDPGTGKSLAAEVIAGELGLRLMRVDISSVVDKYIGETEKNLTRIFANVRADMHLLLFDEADSLFAKRSQKVERSIDRYSNMDINVLLQLIERFEGLAVLTTNLKNSIDPAFERRIPFKVHFKMPGEAEREQLWRRLLPEEHIPTSEEIEYEYLATLVLSGGEIKNAVLKAAYKAAHSGVPLNSDLLMEAGVDEVRGSGRLVRER